MTSTTTELANDWDFVDATRIKAILKLAGNNAPCIFCKTGTDSRTHWRFDCEVLDHLRQHINQSTSEHLSHCGYTFWFTPHLKAPKECNSIGSVAFLLDCNRLHELNSIGSVVQTSRLNRSV